MKPAALACLLATPLLLPAQNADWDALDRQVEQLYLKGDIAGAVRVAKLAVDAASTPKQSGRSLDRLGFLYYNSGNLKDGEAFLRKGLDLRREKLGADSADYAESANDLALFLRDTRRFPEAQALAEEAVAVRSRVLGANDPLVAETLETLGSILSGEGEYGKSAATFEKARSIYESHIDAKNPAPPEYGTLLVNLAGNYHRLGEYHQAETDFDAGLEVLRKTIGATHPIYATSLMGPANLEMELGNYSAAEKFYNEAAPLLKASLGETHPIYVQLLDHRAVLYQAMGNRTGAESDYRTALALRKKIYGPNHVLVAATLRNYGRLVYARNATEGEKLLREAADLSDDAPFARFLRLRADALLDDDYLQSDLAWLELENPRFDVIFAPYETYLDGLLGVKTTYGAAVLVRNDAESRKLDVYQQYVPDIQEALPLAAEDRPSKKGLRSPMQIMEAPFRAGDLRHGYQAVADNLPNDPRVHEQRGSKKIFFKNFMDARVEHVILPIAQRLLRADQAQQASAEGYLAATVMHEISHGLGPAFARVGGGRQDIRVAMGPVFSGLEEAKADIVGLFALKWLVDHGGVAPAKLNGYYISYVAGILRTVRFGIAEAHGRAEMMEFNYLAARGVLVRDPASGRYGIELDRMPGVIADLARQLLQLEASGDRAGAEAWFAKYGAMPPELAQALESARDVPVDIDPVSDFTED